MVIRFSLKQPNQIWGAAVTQDAANQLEVIARNDWDRNRIDNAGGG